MCSGSLQVRVFVGLGPVRGEDLYLAETVRGTDRAARREAEKAKARMQAEVDGQRSARTSVSLGYLLDEWLATVELEDSTRETYVGYIERTIRPMLGPVSIAKLTTRTLETLYAELRRCRTVCDGRPFVVHRGSGEHDCAEAGCAPHVCKPMAASTVRQVHAVFSGALSAAVRWDWLPTNPARGAQRPRQRPPQPDPPSQSDAARIVDAAFADEDFGTLVWLVMTTGMRRGEVCSLRLAKRLGIATHIHALRHSSATELLTAGVDLRTVAGRLGHGGGGATTLRVHAAWVAASPDLSSRG